MRVADKKKIKTDLFSFTIRKAGGLKPLVIDGEVPEEYLKQPEPDTSKIREALKSGQEINWAHLKEPEEILVIR